MVSMKDIANICKVSVATVSKALNDNKDVSEETKQYIKQTAKEMGYFPNSVARALKTNRTYNLGVLFVEEARSGLTHNYFSHVLDSFKVAAETKGYDITFLNCYKNGKDEMSYLEHSKYRGFDGVVIACVNFEDAEVIELINSNIPIVTIDHVFNNRTAIMSDNVKGMETLLAYIYNRGHTKIAYIHGAASSTTRARLACFYKMAEEKNIEVPDDYIKESAYRDVGGAAERTAELLNLAEPPTCILYPDDFAAYGGINVIRAKGLSIPDDISVAGYDGITLAKLIEPRLTTVNQDTRAIGKAAANKLVALIEKPKSTLIERVLIPGELAEGETIKDLN